MIISFKEFEERHKASPKWQNLSKAERQARYQSYVSSVAGASANRQSGPKRQKTVKKMLKADRKASKKSSKVGGTAVGALSGPSYDYASVLHNPFLNVPPVGYPMSGNAPSFKYRGFAVGQMTVGANGSGQVTMSPLICANGAAQGIRYTNTAASNCPGDRFMPPSATGTVTAALNVPLTASSGGAAQTLIRMVAAGIRIRSAQALLEKKGECISLMIPISGLDIDNITFQAALTDYRNFASRHPLNIPESPWFSALWSPTEPPGQLISSSNPRFSQSADAVYDNLSTLSTFTQTNLGIAVQGATPGDIFEWEAYGWYEAFGAAALVTSNSTVTPSDPAGVSLISAAVSKQSINAMTKNVDGAIPASTVVNGFEKALGYMSNLFGTQNATKSLTSSASSDSNLIDGIPEDQWISQMEDRWLNLFSLPSPPSSIDSAAPVAEESLSGVGDLMESLAALA